VKTLSEDRFEELFFAVVDYANQQEAAAVGLRQRVKELTKFPEWNPDKIKWETAQGQKGPYERSEDVNNLQFKAMLKDLAAHSGRLTRNGFFYWIFENGCTVGRKKR